MEPYKIEVSDITYPTGIVLPIPLKEGTYKSELTPHHFL